MDQVDGLGAFMTLEIALLIDKVLLINTELFHQDGCDLLAIRIRLVVGPAIVILDVAVAPFSSREHGFRLLREGYPLEDVVFVFHVNPGVFAHQRGTRAARSAAKRGTKASPTN